MGQVRRRRKPIYPSAHGTNSTTEFLNQFAEAQHTTSEKHNYCCKYTVNVERTLFRSLFRDHTPVIVKPQLDVPWSYEPIKIPVLGTANVGASDGGEIWLSADSLGRLTSTCAGNSSRHITGSGDTKSGAPVSTIGGGSDIDWLLLTMACCHYGT